jgi:sulfur relay (sulfurtransferase) DsrF/TusC family protein
MEKKIAVIIRDRQAEALRMALGLLLLDDTVDVFFLDSAIENTEKNRLQLKTAAEMEINLYTNCSENQDIEQLSVEEIAARLTNYDIVLTY